MTGDMVTTHDVNSGIGMAGTAQERRVDRARGWNFGRDAAPVYSQSRIVAADGNQ